MSFTEPRALVGSFLALSMTNQHISFLFLSTLSTQLRFVKPIIAFFSILSITEAAPSGSQ